MGYLTTFDNAGPLLGSFSQFAVSPGDGLSPRSFRLRIAAGEHPFTFVVGPVIADVGRTGEFLSNAISQASYPMSRTSNVYFGIST